MPVLSLHRSCRCAGAVVVLVLWLRGSYCCTGAIVATALLLSQDYCFNGAIFGPTQLLLWITCFIVARAVLSVSMGLRFCCGVALVVPMLSMSRCCSFASDVVALVLPLHRIYFCTGTIAVLALLLRCLCRYSISVVVPPIVAPPLLSIVAPTLFLHRCSCCPGTIL